MSPAIDSGPDAVSRRLRRVCELADLSAGRRLDAKTGLTPDAVGRQLRLVAQLSELCEKLAAVGRGAGRATRDTP
jgi:hypothetical protein